MSTKRNSLFSSAVDANIMKYFWFLLIPIFSTLITNIRPSLIENQGNNLIEAHHIGLSKSIFKEAPSKNPTNTALSDIFQQFATNPGRFPTAVATNISQQCINDSQLFVNQLSEREPWAIQR